MAANLEGTVRGYSEDSDDAISITPIAVRCGARTAPWRGP